MTTPIVTSITDEQLEELERSTANDLNNPNLQGEARVIVAGIASLIARLRAAEKDSRRLDFMIADPCVMQCQSGSSSPAVFRLYWPREGEHQTLWYATEREAIDTAMEQSK